MTAAALLAELRSPGAHPHKAKLAAICDKVFPGIEARQSWYVLGILGQIDDVLKGAAAPWMSRKERDAIEEAAKEIGERA
jgi:hypothetical protein